MIYDPLAIQKYKERKINKEKMAKYDIQRSYEFL